MYVPTVLPFCSALSSRALRRAMVARKVIFTLRRCALGSAFRPGFLRLIHHNIMMPDNNIKCFPKIFLSRL